MEMEFDSFQKLVGQTLAAVENKNNEELIFTIETLIGQKPRYKLYHRQECCEQVEIVDIEGDLADLVGTPIRMAEIVARSDGTDAGTWTFYKLATIKGYVTIRWQGRNVASLSAYSEAVDWGMA